MPAGSPMSTALATGGGVPLEVIMAEPSPGDQPSLSVGTSSYWGWEVTKFDFNPVRPRMPESAPRTWSLRPLSIFRGLLHFPWVGLSPV
jgi:hypothetical protein